MRQPAQSRLSETGSLNITTASREPTNGAKEKYAPVRAAPRCRSPNTKRAKLTP